MKVSQKTFQILGHIFAKTKDPVTNNEPTPFILFPAMTVTTNASDRPNVSLTRLTQQKSGFLSQKGKFSFIGAHMPNKPHNWLG